MPACNLMLTCLHDATELQQRVCSLSFSDRRAECEHPSPDSELQSPWEALPTIIPRPSTYSLSQRRSPSPVTVKKPTRESEGCRGAVKAVRNSSILRRGRSKSADLETRRAKTVLFSDTMGLPLVQVKHFGQDDNLGSARWASDVIFMAGSSPNVMRPRFRFVGLQPCSCADFAARLRQQAVCLESVRVSDDRAAGCVQVSNLHFEKAVFIRFTTDGWRTHTDMSARYAGSLGPDVDRFSFTMPLFARRNSKLMFAIGYQTTDKEYWDNNYGGNYHIDS